jgi:Cof subfamily protein (haloacid dehalogenase superfamily)
VNHPRRPIRLVALDLDGTTLNRQHQLNPATIEAVQAVTARGVRVVLASGRLLHSILPVARQLGLDGLHFALNGGVSFDLDGVVRHQHTLTVDQLAYAHEVLADEGLDAMVFGATGLWTPRVSEDVEFILSFGEPAPRLYTLDALDRIEAPVKVLTVLDAGPRDAELEARVHPRLHAVRTGPKFYELMAPGVSKGAALAEYLAELGIETDEVMAIGDSENDASMLAAAGFAVAMGNAVPALKAAADAVTATNGDDGVAVALRRWVLDFDGQ